MFVFHLKYRCHSVIDSVISPLSCLRSLLLETHKQVIKQRDEFYQESERLRQMATPRPDWPRCGEVIAGGMPTVPISI